MRSWAPEQVVIPSSAMRPRIDSAKSVLVVGGGLAGIAAATILAERGVSVTVLERGPVLGGRLSSWTEELASGESVEMERGFHAFFRQYYNLRALLRRIDPELRNLVPMRDYPLLGPDGAQESFSGLPKHAPFNVMSLVFRSPSLTLSDLSRVNVRAALQMLMFDMERTYADYDHHTAHDYLASLQFPPRAKQMLFDVFAHSFFNPEDQMSAGELLMMFHFYFLGNPEGLIFDVLNEPFSVALWRPFQRYLHRLGVSFLMETSVSRVTRLSDGGWRVHLGNRNEWIDGDAVVLALSVPAVQALVAQSPDLSNPAWRASIDQLSVTHPFAVWRAWLDEPCNPGRHPFVGTTGLGVLDNISLFHLFEGESRRWAMVNGGSVIELHAYAVDPNAKEQEIREEFLRSLHQLYPETKRATILDERFIMHQDCPAFPPDAYRNRPEVLTPQSGLVLAGDYVKLPFPTALMERAASSGIWAANHLLERWGVRAEPVWSVPRQGLLAGRMSL